MLLRNVRLSGEPLDVLIDGGEIVAVGRDDEAWALATGGHPTVDLAGRWLVPGLWDNHVHFTQWALSSRRMDIGSAASAHDAARIAGDALRADDAPATPFVATGFRDGLWPDAPTLELLDAQTGAWPTVLVSADLHAVWLNTPALALYGHAGHPTGLLREDPAFEITGRIDDLPVEVLDAWAKSAADAAAARGVVGIIDYEMTWSLDVWQRRMAAGVDSLRVEFGIYTAQLDRAIELGLRTGDRVTDLLSVGGYKVLTDGSLNTRTAYCYDDYPGMHGEHARGMLTVPPEQLVPLMRRASAAGIVPAVHAIGDLANTLALDAFEEIGSGGRIEHAQLLNHPDLARFGRLGVVASVQPEHAMDDRDVADRYWAGRTDRAFVLKSLLESGAELALGSDAPVAPLDPWITIAAAVGRARDGREPWHPEQAISVGEAITASSRTSIAVGNRADLVVVDADPLTADAEQLRAMPVAGTLLGGRWTHGPFE